MSALLLLSVFLFAQNNLLCVCQATANTVKQEKLPHSGFLLRLQVRVLMGHLVVPDPDRRRPLYKIKNQRQEPIEFLIHRFKSVVSAKLGQPSRLKSHLQTRRSRHGEHRGKSTAFRNPPSRTGIFCEAEDKCYKCVEKGGSIPRLTGTSEAQALPCFAASFFVGKPAQRCINTAPQ